MQPRLKSFRDFCEKNNYQLLKDDYEFIGKMLDRCYKTNFKALLSGYLKEWRLGMSSARSSNTAQSEGRKKANYWLLEFADKNSDETCGVICDSRIGYSN